MAKSRLLPKLRPRHLTALAFILFSWGLIVCFFSHGGHIPQWLGFSILPLFLTAMLGLLPRNVSPYWIFGPVEGGIAVISLLPGTAVISAIYGAIGALIGIVAERTFLKNSA